MEFKPQVFVAMSFSEQYAGRFEKVIAPAISATDIGGVPLKPYRVDLSKSGDSILTDIMDGIAHSKMILADVSSVGRDAISGSSYRNGNVMYEVGIALACRHSNEVLLVRDDKDKFLFDVSTVPHMNIDFTDIENARTILHNELKERLNEQNYINDARVQMALASLSNQEIKTLEEMLELPESGARGWEITGTLLSIYEMAISRLLDKRLIRVIGRFTTGNPAYQLTYFGRIVANLTKSGLRIFTPDKKESPEKQE